MDPLAFAGALALDQGDEDGLGEEVAGGEVGDRDADADGSGAGQSVDGHDPAESLGDLVDAGAPGVGSVLAEAGDAAVDDARVAGAAGVVVDAEASLDVGAVVLDDDVGALDQGEEDLDGLGLLEVEGEGALVAVQVEEVGGLAGAGDAFALSGDFGLLDLEHVGAPVAELSGGGGAGAGAGEVEDEEVVEGEVGHGGQAGTAAGSVSSVGVAFVDVVAEEAFGGPVGEAVGDLGVGFEADAGGVVADVEGFGEGLVESLVGALVHGSVVVDGVEGENWAPVSEVVAQRV